jgi:aerobic C4-dicarboxylate transport protein
MARLLFCIDRVLAIATSTVNGVGNSVAVLVLSKWENMFDGQKFDACLGGGGAIPAEPRPAILPGDHA